MAQKFNGQPTLVASLTAAIRRNLNAASNAADRIMAGTPAPGDVAVLRTGEKCLHLLMAKAVS